MVAIVAQFEQLLRAVPPGGPGVGRCVGVASLTVSGCSWLLLVSLQLWGGASPALAQNEPEQPNNPPPMLLPLPDVLSEGTLQPKARLWLSDRDGNQILVPEESAEEYFLARGQNASGGFGFPPVTLQSVVVDGRVQGEVADLTGRFSVVLAQEIATTVNLSFGSVQLTDSSFSGPVEHNRLQMLRDDPGWRWIVLSEPNSTQVATLSGVSRIEVEEERHNLRISLPVAPCQLTLKLPANADDIRVRNEDVLQRRESVGDVVEVEIACRGGEFLVSWRDRAEVPQVAAVIASSQTRFEIVDPTQPWLARTKLEVRWHGRDAANQVRIELPAGGQWGPLPNSDTERFIILGQDAGNVTDESATSEAAGGPLPTAAMPLLLENFDVTRNESIEIDLEWEWLPRLPDSTTASVEVKLQTPQLSGVDQHTGLIDCVVSSAYAVVFKEGTAAQLIHQAPLMDPFARQQLQFRFDVQSYDLQVAFRREQSLPTIRPTYLVQVDANKLTLTMWFDCSFDTNQPQMELGLMLDEWVIQENTARTVPAATDLFSTTGEVLRVMQQVDRSYLIRSAGLPNNNFGTARHIDQTWRVVAERAWTAEDHELYFQVPRIIRGRVNGAPEVDHGSGALLITSNSNVLLSWQETAGTGLQRDSFSTEYQRYAPQSGLRKPMVYRFQSSETTPRWAGRAELLPRQMTAAQQIELSIGVRQISVVQDFQLQVAHEPVDELRFAVREDVADSQPPQALIDGQLLSTRLLETVPESQGVAWQLFEVLGSPEILGTSQLRIQTSVPWKPAEPLRSSESAVEAVEPGTSEEPATRVDVPLARLMLPSGGRFIRQTWTLQNNPQIEAVVGGSLSLDSVSEAQRSGELLENQSQLSFELRPRRALGLAAVAIEASWLQSFVNSQKRRERFVARLRSSSNELRLRLPRDANIREGLVKVAVDGFSQRYVYDQPSDIVTIPLAGAPNALHVVEVSYFLPDSLSWINVLKVTPPEILGAAASEQFYWQLLTPSVQHLGWSPREFTAEWTWEWGGFCWQRASQLTQRQLEEMLGARPQEPPPASANRYVMSGRGIEGSSGAWVLSRFILWFPVGLLAIAITFVALNFPIVRRPTVVFALAVTLAGLATIWPDLAALAGQTALLSLGLVALVWVLQAAVDSRVRRRSVFATRPSTYMDRSDHVSLAVRGSRSGPASPVHGSSAGASGG